MGLVTAEPDVWTCFLQLTLSLVGIPLIPIALVAYASFLLGRVLWAIARPPHRIRRNPLEELCGVSGLIIGAPFFFGFHSVWCLARKAGRSMREHDVRDDIDESSASGSSPSLYAPLVGTYDVRILRIEPAAALEAPLALSLRVARPYDRPRYDALSYMWADEEGDDARTVPVAIRREDDNSSGPHTSDDDVYQTFVTKNCDSALRRLRHADRPRYMGIDALCINQADVAERTHQVLLMSRIYVGAEHVVVYTGEATPLTDRLFGALNQLPDDDISESPPLMAFLNRRVSSDLLLPSLVHARWVLQEVSLPDPRRTRILCGAKTTTAGRALQAIPLMQRHLPGMASRALHIFLLVRRDPQMLPFRSLLWPGTVNKLRCSPLLDILVATRDRQAQDPRDQIFGVLSLAKGLEAAAGLGTLLLSAAPGLSKPKADYTMDVAQVYTRYSEFLLETHGVGFFLVLLLPRTRKVGPRDSDDDNAMAKLPSWAADWSGGSRWMNARAVRGYELACSGKEKLDTDDVWFRDGGREWGGRRIMVLQGRRRIRRGWFSRHVSDAEPGREEKTAEAAIEDVVDLKMDPSLVLVSMYPGVAVLLREVQDEEEGMFEFLQVCAHTRTRRDVANVVESCTDVVVRGGDKVRGDEIVDYLGAPETFEIL
ncbi:hypothetical protein PG994_009612 [Apiospora phragmitis]|uniref:Heterokaryon incompatibility domain-containing protein n=1 Tax=Apiospora phragmitis TaxID=2905665 RepID=A0ABR1U8X4_9PEZI